MVAPGRRGTGPRLPEATSGYEAMTSTRKLQRVLTTVLVVATAALCLVVGTTPAAADGSLSYSF